MGNNKYLPLHGSGESGEIVSMDCSGSTDDHTTKCDTEHSFWRGNSKVWLNGDLTNKDKWVRSSDKKTFTSLKWLPNTVKEAKSTKLGRPFFRTDPTFNSDENTPQVFKVQNPDCHSHEIW